MKFKIKNILPVLVIIGFFLIFYLIESKIPEETIKNTINNFGSFGPIILILLIWSTNVIAPLSASPFLLAGFYLFGEKVVVYAYIAAFIASISNFWISRIWGRSLVEKLTGPENLKKLEKFIDSYGLPTLFASRIFLGMFYDVISYAFGLTKIKFIPYLIVSAVGMIPGSLLWLYLSSKINNPFAFIGLTLVMSYIFLTAYILGVNIKKRKIS